MIMYTDEILVVTGLYGKFMLKKKQKSEKTCEYTEGFFALMLIYGEKKKT